MFSFKVKSQRAFLSSHFRAATSQHDLRDDNSNRHFSPSNHYVMTQRCVMTAITCRRRPGDVQNGRGLLWKHSSSSLFSFLLESRSSHQSFIFPVHIASALYQRWIAITPRRFIVVVAAAARSAAEEKKKGE